ncbi:MAG: 1-acyl-sn-glycerol-3-phosphate acyltransferase [Chloroflexi bacterium]|nr:1-acyl-sn-glycerol-3-phosphate acyltransferase [Chloroflexota bacterium]
MSSSSAPVHSPAHDVVYRQDQYTLRRHILHRLLRVVGFGLLVRVQVEGRENIPVSGPTLLIMNHIGALDPFVVTGVVTSRYVVPMSKIENYKNPLSGFIARSWGVYPVRRGEVDRRALASTIELLRQERPVLIAPEGTRHTELAEPKRGMTYVAAKADAVVVPIGLEGTPDFPSSYKRLRRPRVQVRIGRPFRFKTDGRQRIPRDELQRMTQEAMYQIAVLLPEYRRGVYSDLSLMTTDHLEFIDPRRPAAGA